VLVKRWGGAGDTFYWCWSNVGVVLVIRFTGAGQTSAWC
jgi:hypothetical protein